MKALRLLLSGRRKEYQIEILREVLNECKIPFEEDEQDYAVAILLEPELHVQFDLVREATRSRNLNFDVALHIEGSRKGLHLEASFAEIVENDDPAEDDIDVVEPENVPEPVRRFLTHPPGQRNPCRGRRR